MTPIRALTALLLALALGAGGFAVRSYRSMTERVVSLEQTAKDYADLKVSFDALRKEVVFRKDFDAALRANRASISYAIQQAAHEDKAVAGFLAAPLPDGLREAYLKAREQRVALPHND